MKLKKMLNSILDNNLVILIVSFVVAMMIWVLVVVNVSPKTTRVIKDVRVTIDKTIPSQFDLEVFGETEFLVDVTVTGKKYQISSASLSAEDIVVTAVTNNVNSAGIRTVQLKAEPAVPNASFSISNVSSKYIDVYFDTVKTETFVIEPDVVCGDSSIVAEGYTKKDTNISNTVVNVTGPSTEVNKVERAVARYKLDKPLTSNLSAETDVLLLDDKGESSFKYLTMDVERVVLTIPVLRLKALDTIVSFKNAPDKYVATPIPYTVSPSTAVFEVLVDECNDSKVFSIGTVDFNELSPGNKVFTFDADQTSLADETVESFYVTFDMKGFTQKSFTIDSETFKINNPDKKAYTISGLDKNVRVVGKAASLKNIDEKMISVEIDLSGVELSAGETAEVPAYVMVNSSDCWVYGTYMVQVSN